ncbi:Thioredoxin-1 [Serratia liquefaciens]|jgi:thioredoxin 1|uniref:Thioredoxin n=2 Tax=Serratia liquefaciens TaxID=614 RepID=A0A379Y776_SERLI|nr:MULTISPECIES: thioredoxin TrxA [Serratia]AGQ28990.1 thioredoxin [Serratia liquefaciens ATCC 27592]AKE12578.1 thioredoxin [Serratia liquefaciens]AMG99764.1 thioredoxin TrxA [Serratia liquefaciens]AYO40603.1 thioredoxin TrxA [Serratia sp. P2ACOL2]MBF8107594.1 thioredoxin TrxA [Serratia liquefaciens]|eukprot:TRINITY_DN15655_c0_g1_i1.p1 TRINITY_DN15655_c0_g1~~TRINITY_DN15655_c0_g1_i1.p1  ORF type:complete len:109 (-),score=20.80 TRINITY_DN15655_c0_g1_i1:127-453(-)
MSDKIIHLTDGSFENDVLKAEGPILVDFWAEWCGPCKMIAPILDEIAEEFEGKLTITKLNIDQNPATAPKYGIRGIPTLLLFKNGEVAATKVGALSKGQLKDFLNANL